MTDSAEIKYKKNDLQGTGKNIKRTDHTRKKKHKKEQTIPGKTYKNVIQNTRKHKKLWIGHSKTMSDKAQENRGEQ